ncbi:hypothetical protein RB653_007851 [Dictyostelium firmibasis]|uniref:SHSP domain-containing protein n=1 Tax=Dictyostelium firmibasis TaxID=79012 RepID=A0AAN7TMH3_9MYCE
MDPNKLFLKDDLLKFNPFGTFTNFVSSPVPYDCYHDKSTSQTVLIADLPGVSPNDIKVNIDSKKLTILGKRDCEKHDYLFSNRWCGSFTHQIDFIGDVPPSNINVNLNEGLLKVTISNTPINNVVGIQMTSNNKIES